ncbi:MAG TPA: trimethylamine methyltransferase family protein [Clostridiales bacterium]|nr:trimethylamine methyltransferase family protein [Clostridiales bacterium]
MSIEGIQSFYYKNQTKYHAVSEAECEQLIEAALKVMSEIGLMIKNPAAIERLVKAGCMAQGEIVKIPASLVKAAIASAPSEMVLYDRNGNDAIRAGGTANYYGNGPTNPSYNDFETGERRPAVRADVAKNALVSDACPNLDFIMGLAQVSDCDQRIADVVELREILPNTTKPIIAWGLDVDNFKAEVDMAAAVAGGLGQLREKPFLAIFPGCPITPLVINELLYDKLAYGIDAGLPIIWPTGPQPGSTSPVTLAGSISMGLAEVFCGLVLSQLIKEGSVFVGGVVIVSVDMATSQSSYGSPEHSLAESIVADIFHYLDLPMFQTGGVTDSKAVDEQSAIEVSMQILSNALSGGHLVHDVGFMDAAMSASLEQIVLCDEVIGYARRIARGVEINKNTLAFDAIKEIGAGGQFLTHEHTFQNFRNEMWRPTLMDHRSYQSWILDPSDMRTRIHNKTAGILAEHKPEPLSEEVIKELDAILKRAEDNLK